MSQWTRRTRYLMREEGLFGEKARALCFSDAVVRMLRHVDPGPSGYLLDAALSADQPEERSAWLHLLRYRYARFILADDDDSEVSRKVSRLPQDLMTESAGLGADVIARLIERGVLPAGFTAPEPSPALRGLKD
jgi:hypothetical protein